MDKRKLSKETESKILKIAVDIIHANADKASDYTCGDWTGEDSPEEIFTENELNDISFNFHIENTCGNVDNSDLEYNVMYDEGGASSAIAYALQDIINKGEL